MKSLSEIETISKRATKAAGFSWGIAEEVGKNIRILEMFGLSGIKNLNYYIKAKSNNNYEQLKLLSYDNKSIKDNFCPIISGVGFMDQVKSLENFDEIKFEKIAYPILFLPFISRASEIIGKKISLTIDNKSFLLNYNNCIYTNSLNNGIIELGSNVVINFLENLDSFNEKEWNELYIQSKKTFVDESESLKYDGAGAGLTDND